MTLNNKMLGKTDGRYLPTHLYLSPFKEKIKKETMPLFSQESFFTKYISWKQGDQMVC